MKRCWICQSEDLSDEHKIKSSDLRRNYGKRYRNGKVPLQYFTSATKGVDLENYKDNLLKFIDCICVECNNNRTKPHDDAYDQFIAYVSSNYDKIFEQKKINFEEIFKSDYKIKKRCVYKYFAKHAGCKIVTGKIKSNIADLSEFILNDKNSHKFKLHFQIKEGIKTIMDGMPEYFHLYNGQTTYVRLSDENGFTGWQSYHWFTTNWFYSSQLAVQNRINDAKEETVEVKYQDECISSIDKLNIHSIELCGLETIDKIAKNFKLMTEKVYH